MENRRAKKRGYHVEYKSCAEEFEVGGFMAKKSLWKIVQKRMLDDRGALPKEDGNQLWE